MASTIEITQERVLEALKTVPEPELGKDLVTLNMVKDISICGGAVKFTVELTTPACPLKKMIEDDCKRAVSKIPGVEEVTVNLTSNVRRGHDQAKGGFATGVKNFLAVGSGKGGVGKSTVAVNVAVGLAAAGAKVGLLDTDVYGPSVPILTGLTLSPEQYAQEYPPIQGELISPGDDAHEPQYRYLLRPIEKFGLKIMSIGFLVDPSKAVVWRGPMVHGAIQQFLRDVEWGELDYLVMDMPPGTGDVQLTLSQTVPLTGAVIVCTPQPVALADARKAVQMFETTRTPVLGLVENMSYFECRHCHEKEPIFGSGGAERAASEWNIPFLGSLPIETTVRTGGDEGKPVMTFEGEPSIKGAFRNVVERIAAEVSKRNAATGARKRLPITRS
jgi:ATP-binding protein involved in chromosome partitioning